MRLFRPSLPNDESCLLPVVKEKQDQASSLPVTKSVSLYNTHTGEFLRNCQFWQGDQLCPSSLAELNYFCRDHRTGDIHSIDPHLILLLHHILQALETNKLVHVVSGYRSAMTNKSLRQQSQGVARNSYHTKGQALDFYIEGHSLRSLHKAALSLKAGGVGGYNQFIHIDTGPVRRWGIAC